MNAENVDWSVHDQQAGYSLPSRYFYDQRVFDCEKSKIFFKSWHLVAHVGELREPGSFVTKDIFEQSVIVIAGRSGEIRAFHNVCQHRGNRLAAARRGKSPTLTCGYHAWSYGLDGCLRGAPNAQGLEGFRKSDHGLKPVRVEIFASFVFINLDALAKPIAEMAPGADGEIRRFIPDLDRLKLIEEVDVPVAANWKVIQENSIEGYHFDYSGPAHKQLVQLIEFAGYTLSPHGDWWTYVGPPKKGASHAYGLPLEGATWQTDWFFNFGLWPNATIYAFPYADMVGTFIMIPTGPETSVLRFGYYGVEGRELPDVTKACIRWMNEELGPEDIRLNKSNQLGLRSFGFDRGRYLIGDGITNRSEHLVRHFHKLCYDAIHS
jgi:phenylpropionate dioxygenase-like ring-hydroxylating dioxygenase large terminal subunit